MFQRMIAALLISLLALVLACEENPARQELARMNVKYSKHELLKRVEDSDLATVELFLAAGMDPDTKDREGATALMYAAANGDIDCVRLLLEHGADVNTKDKYGGTALNSAAGGLVNRESGNHADVIRLLVERGADVNAQAYGDSWTPLMRAAQKGNLDIVRFLVEHGANVNAEAEYRRTALMDAVQDAPIEVIKFLLEHGADPSIEMEGPGGTALSLAEHMNRPEVVKLLKEAGAKE